MNDDGGIRLDAMLEELPQEVLPERDLWAQIEAGFEERRGSDASWRPAVLRLAAAAMLIVGSSLTTAWYLQRDMPTQVAALSDDLAMVPASLTNNNGLGQKYTHARRLLLVDFEARFVQLPEESREAVIQNLQVIRTALEDINAALASNPDNTLLQQLLVTTYQEELDVLAGVNSQTLTRTET